MLHPTITPSRLAHARSPRCNARSTSAQRRWTHEIGCIKKVPRRLNVNEGQGTALTVLFLGVNSPQGIPSQFGRARDMNGT